MRHFPLLRDVACDHLSQLTCALLVKIITCRLHPLSSKEPYRTVFSGNSCWNSDINKGNSFEGTPCLPRRTFVDKGAGGWITTLIARFMGPIWGPTWGRQDPGGPHVGPMNVAIWVRSMILNPSGQWPAYGRSLLANVTQVSCGSHVMNSPQDPVSVACCLCENQFTASKNIDLSWIRTCRTYKNFLRQSDPLLHDLLLLCPS